MNEKVLARVSGLEALLVAYLQCFDVVVQKRTRDGLFL